MPSTVPACLSVGSPCCIIGVGMVGTVKHQHNCRATLSHAVGASGTATKVAASADRDLLQAFLPDNWRELAAETGALKGLRKDRSAESHLCALLEPSRMRVPSALAGRTDHQSLQIHRPARPLAQG